MVAFPLLVTGATGFLGRHVMNVLTSRYHGEVVRGVGSRDYDLLDSNEVRRMFEEKRPRTVVHLAGYSGGIGANNRYPADFYFRNTLMTALVFQAAAEAKVAKLLYPMGGCSYPADAKSPIDESQLFRGYPQEESAGYSTAKMMGVVAARSYRKQYGLNATVIVPGNMYGEYDNYTHEESHVIPALIRRFSEAVWNGTPVVEMWGSGKPTRDFVYAGDVAATFPFWLEKFDETGPVNISSGTSTAIRALAEDIADVTGFKGELRWDTSKPDGQANKIFSAEKLNSLGLRCSTPLPDGLRRTARWFQENYATRGDGLRL